MKEKFFILGVVLSCFQYSFAQKDSISYQPKLQFLTDTFLLGKTIPVALVFRYPKHWQVLFPDSSFNYTPFEWQSKDIFPTQTQGSISKDSAVLWLKCFEIEPVQKLRLPVFHIQPNGDSLAFFSNYDSVFFRQYIHSNRIDTLTIKADTEYANFPEKINFHAWIVGAVTLFFISAIVWLFFGDWIKKQIILLNLKRRQVLFEDNFEKEMLKIRTRKRLKDIEQAFILWKKHLEQIEGEPYSSYTSSEIVEILKTENLAESLQNIDRAIYGTIVEDSLEKDLAFLKTLAKERYHLKKQSIKNA
ncbi:MAG: hypothetical protein RMJ97_07240 [Raineya sp.]|nr:hypothetical protein [Raineya sp.]MDW8296665.1 hypothetical protein [Raineya sp.]